MVPHPPPTPTPRYTRVRSDSPELGPCLLPLTGTRGMPAPASAVSAPPFSLSRCCSFKLAPVPTGVGLTSRLHGKLCCQGQRELPESNSVASAGSFVFAFHCGAQVLTGVLLNLRSPVGWDGASSQLRWLWVSPPWLPGPLRWHPHHFPAPPVPAPRAPGRLSSAVRLGSPVFISSHNS